MRNFNYPPNPILIENRLRELITGSDHQLVDPEGTHHVLASGLHGRKIDFEKIPTKSSDFDKWVNINAEFYCWLLGAAGLGKIALVGVANGTNRLVGPLAQAINNKDVLAVQTLKDPFRLSAETIEQIGEHDPSTLIMAEDVSSTGGSLVQVFDAFHREYTDVRNVYAMLSVQRSKVLQRLVGTSIEHHSIVNYSETYPIYHSSSCPHCADGWHLIERSVSREATTD